MFTIANEFERYPDGKYQFDPADVEWARAVPHASARSIPSTPLDVTHPSGSPTKTRRPRVQDRSPPTRDLRNVVRKSCGPLGEGGAVNLNVTQNNEGVQPATLGQLLTEPAED